MIRVSVVAKSSPTHNRPIFAWVCPLCGKMVDENVEESRVANDAVEHLMIAHNVLTDFIRIWVGAHG